MVIKEYKVIDPEGLPATVATQVVNVTSQFQSKIKFIVDHREADAKSIINLMALHIQHDDLLTINIVGNDAHNAMDAIVNLLTDLKVI